MIITCRTFTHLVDDAREGELSAFGRARVKFHHLICPMCRRYVRGLDATVSALHEVPEEPAPAETKAMILQRLREKRGA